MQYRIHDQISNFSRQKLTKFSGNILKLIFYHPCKFEPNPTSGIFKFDVDFDIWYLAQNFVDAVYAVDYFLTEPSRPN